MTSWGDDGPESLEDLSVIAPAAPTAPTDTVDALPGTLHWANPVTELPPGGVPGSTGVPLSQELHASGARRFNRTMAWVMIALWAILGLLVLVRWYARLEQLQPVPGGRTTTGTVVSAHPENTCGRYGCATTWVATVRFTAADGRTITFTAPPARTPAAPGETQRVSYEPDDPSDAHDLSVSSTPVVTVMLLGGALVVLALLFALAGFERVHRRFKMTSAPERGGWVGHPRLHSPAVLLAVTAAVVVLFVAVDLFLA